MSDRSFCYNFIDAFLVGGAVAAFVYTNAYLLKKTFRHDREIEELFSLLEECEEKHESCED